MSKINVIVLLISLFLIAECRITRHSQDTFSKHKTFVESHRGVNREIFQNTREAFQRVIDYGIESFETDTWMTKDGVFVLVHAGSGGDLTGFYDKGGNVIDLTWEELKTYRTIQDNLPMPRLDEIMELTKGKVFMNLEIKDSRIEEVWPKLVELIEKYDYFDQICLSSFVQMYYYKVDEYNKNHDKKLVFGFLWGKGSSKSFDYTKKGHQLHIYWTDATKEVCDKAHENGMAIQAWFNMGEPESTKVYKILIENGADVICCNVPLLAKKYRDSYYGE